MEPKETQKPKERAIVFIDGNNLHRGLKKCYGIERLDLEPFCRQIVQNRELVRIYYADANYLHYINLDSYKHQQAYFSHIRKIKNLVFRRGYYNKWHKPPVEKKVDVYLATDLVDLCYQDDFDYTYLVSGDTDLCPAVDIVVAQGKTVMNVYFHTTEKNSYAVRSSCKGKFKNITKIIAEQYKWEYK